MNKKISALFIFFMSLNLSNLAIAKAESASSDTSNSFTEEEDEEEKDEKKEREKRKQRRLEKELEKKRQESLKREKADLKKQEELDAIRDADANKTLYRVTPDSVKLLVELEPGSTGYKGRDHNMTFMFNADPFFTGRGFLSYEYRFFEYVSASFKAGIESTGFSLASKVRQQLDKPYPSQFSVLGGVGVKWRLTEWFLNSSIYLESSLLTGRLWQTLVDEKTTHWRLKPAGFVGLESVFNSGFAFNVAVGAEYTYDFAQPNPIKEGVDPAVLFGFGLAL